MPSTAFFRDVWRRRPLHVPGGAGQLRDFAWDRAAFDAALAAARAADPDAVRERAGEVAFVENVDRFVAAPRRRARALREHFGVGSLWFDSVRTTGPGSIGCHFDHSDNFVLQCEGVKVWRLWPAEVVPAAQRRARMLGRPGVGAVVPPEDGYVEIELRPGDLLYIPLLWPHWGVAEADSLSLSLVCGGAAACDELLELARVVLRGREVAAEALPALAGDADQRHGAVDEVRDAVRSLAAALGDERTVHAIAEVWARHRARGDEP
ncbi:MAG: hypothetical protein H6708_16695 [Kofleriaceae bacterium]|nr:hypothetical protein [Kofleriaceae bacterium]